MSDDAKSAMRLDKFLWAARFFKTRSLATTAIEGGRVNVNGERAKPAKQVKPGDAISLRKPPFEFEFAVTALSDRRGPASEARKLYAEAPQSVAAREKLSAELREMPPPLFKGRPTKKDRRLLNTFQRQSHDEE